MNATVDHEMKRISDLDERWKLKAENELGETQQTTNRTLNDLRLLINAHHGRLEFSRLDDAFLLRFLRAKKFDAEKAFKMLQKYLQMKKQFPELFQVTPIADLAFMLRLQIQYMLPMRDGSGRQVYIFRVEKCDPYKCPVELVFRSNVLALENAVRDPETQIAGLVVLLDMAGLSFGHARFLSTHLAKRTVEVIQEAFPMRFKAFHILHEPFYMDAILTVLKPFLKDKIRKRIHLHGRNLASLHRYIPKGILPLEYGGEQPSFDNSKWSDLILESQDYFTDLETFNRTGNGESPSFGDNYSSNGVNLQFFDAETEDSEIGDDSGTFYNVSPTSAKSFDSIPEEEQKFMQCLNETREKDVEEVK